MKTLAISLLLFCMFTGLNAESIVRAETPAEGVTMDFKDARLQSALDILFRGGNKSFILDSGIDKNIVIPDLSLQAVSFDDALKAITKAAGVSYSKNGNGIYVITPRKKIVIADPIPDPQVPQPDITADQPKLKVEKVYLGFIDAQDLAAMFGATGFRSRSSTMVTGGNSGMGTGYPNQQNMNGFSGWGMNPGNQYNQYNNPPALHNGIRNNQPQVASPGVKLGY